MPPDRQIRPQRVIAVLNLGSGVSFSTAEKADAARVEAAFRRIGLPAEVRAVHAQEMTEALRRAAAERPDVLVMGGGDGSVNAAVNILAGTGTILAVLPLGTFNYFARLIGTPLTVDEAVQFTMQGQAVSMDLLDVGGRLAATYCSAGVFARFISERVLLQKRRGLPKLRAMLLALVSVLWRFPSFSLRLDADGHQVSLRTAFLFAGNACAALNPMTLDSGPAEFQDARFCLIVGRGGKRRSLLRLALRSLFGHIRQDRDFLVRQVASLVVSRRSGKPVRLSIDGEIVSLPTPLTVRVRPAALRVMIPRRRPS